MSEIIVPWLEEIQGSPEVKTKSLMIGEGRFIIERMLLSGILMHSIVCENKYLEFWNERSNGKCPVSGVDEAELKKMAGYDFHRGVLAAAYKPASLYLANLPLNLYKNLLVLPSLGDPDNFGTILRTAACFDVDAILTGSGCPDPFTRRVLRKSMGHCLFIPLLQWDNRTPLAAILQEAGFTLFAADCSEGASALQTVVMPGKKALIMGHESDGLPTWCDQAQKVIIPMKPGADSLNVAVAAGILMNYFFSPAKTL